MRLNDYQEKAMETALYPEKGTGSKLALSYVALGLGESGEVQGKIKKYLRGDYGETLPQDMRRAILDEVGDLLWYVAGVTEELGSDLDLVATRNLEKLASRAQRGVIKGSGDTR